MGILAGTALGIALLTGCTQTGLTTPKRSATEELLISTAADRAIEQADFSIVKDKKIFVDPTYCEVPAGPSGGDSATLEDKQYLIGTVRDFVSKNGGLLVAKAEDSDLIIEPRSGALSIDASSSTLGIPGSTTAPIPLAGAVQLPEMALFKSEKQFSIAKIAILAYERESRKHVASSGPLVGRANIKYYKFLGYIGYTKTTVPERKRQKDKKEDSAPAERP
jgi:hypothetical protein